jgi:CHAD domain-containing protein
MSTYKFSKGMSELGSDSSSISVSATIECLAAKLLGQAQAAARRIHRRSRVSDKEALHQFRVAIRRLRILYHANNLNVPESRLKIAKKLRSLTTSTNAARDLETAIQWVMAEAAATKPSERHGASFLLRHYKAKLKGEFTRLRTEVLPSFELIGQSMEKRFSYLMKFDIPAIHLAPDSAYSRFTGSQIELVSAKLATMLPVAVAAKDTHILHRIRLKVKRLRYLMEPFRPNEQAAKVVLRLKHIQDVLGELNDRQVFMNELICILMTPKDESTSHVTPKELLGLQRLLCAARSQRDRLIARATQPTFEAEILGAIREAREIAQVLRAKNSILSASCAHVAG